MRIMNFLTKKTQPPKKIDLPLLLLNGILALLTVSAIVIANRHFYKNSQVATLNDNIFLTTEWRLLKELKDRTDQLLQDKDQEIQELRQRYRTLQSQQASPSLLESIEIELAKVESERDAILSARFLPGAPALASVNAGTAAPAPSRPSDSALAELLGNKIRALEEELALGRQGADDLIKERDSLLSQLEATLVQAITIPQSQAPEPSSALSPDAYLDILRSKRDALSSNEPTLNLSDIRTRTLLRAIVRTPAIQAEYPTLSDDLDRYFQVFAEVERFKATRESYEELIAAIGALTEE